MQILFLSFHFDPDLGPVAIRNSLIARALSIHDTVDKINVITTLPNRWGDIATDAPTFERDGNLTIHRVKVGKYRNGVANQALVFAAYARQVIYLTKNNSYDLVYASSSKLATGFLGAYIARNQGALYYLDIRDLFMETINEYYPSNIFKIFFPIFSWINRYSIRNADKINILSEEFSTHIKKINSLVPLSSIPHGVDSQFQLINNNYHKNEKCKEILYAGNVGFGQSLETIISAVSQELPTPWRITVIGSGASIEKFKIQTRELRNVNIEKPIARNDLIKRYQRTDVLLLHLNAISAFKKTLPSKIFEYAATGKPILVGAEGYLLRFIRENKIPGVYTFTPNDASSFFHAFEKIEKHHFDRGDFVKNWSREEKVREMVNDIVSLRLGNIDN